MKHAKTTSALLLLSMACSTAYAQLQPPPAADGSCPSGMHLVHTASGSQGIVDPDTFMPSPQAWAEYHCATNSSPTALSCGLHGQASASEGVAACECAEGYAGDSCNVCATGYEMNTVAGAAPSCAPIAVNREVAILGSDRVVPYGGSTLLSAENITARPGTPTQVSGRWSLSGDPAVVGCLVAADGSCGMRAEGASVTYMPPAQGNALNSAEVAFYPDNGLGTKTDVTFGPPGIPINGWADGDTLPFVNELTDFMKARCVGAASIGVAKHGKVVLALGLGMKDGRNAETIFNAGCGNDSVDPFKPAAGEMQYNTPFMYGSVAKSTTFATARWTLKRALAKQDEDVRLISQSANRLVSASRVSTNEVRLDVWSVDGSGNFTRLGSHRPETAKDFSLVRMGDTRFVLVTRDADNKLGVYGYAIDAAGNLSVTDTLNGVTEVKDVEVTAIANQRVVLGMRRSDDSLQVRTFKFEANGTFTQLDSETGGTARDFRMVAIPGTSRVVGAARLADPDVIKFIVWDVDAAGVLTRVFQGDFDGQFYDTSKFDIAALSSSRIVFAAQQYKQTNGTLQVMSVAGNGALGLVGGTFFTGSDFRIETLDSTHFALASKDASDNGAVRQFALSNQGLPFQVGNAAAGGKFVSLDLANASSAGWGSGFVTVSRDSSDILRMNSWDVGANSITKLKLGTGANPVKDYAWNDDDVEALQLVGFDFPDALLSKRLHNIVAGYEQPPLAIDASDPRTGNSCTKASSPGHPFADTRWKNITMGHFFSHRAGLNVSTRSAESLYKNNIDELRQLTNKYQWNAEQDRLIDEWGASNVQNARVAMGLSPLVNVNSPDGFVVRRLSLEDLLVGSASMCLPNPQGSYAYSNTDPQWTRTVIEHVSGQPYTAPVGNPAAVEGTLVNDFIKAELNLDSNGFNNIAARPAAMNAQGDDPWSGARGRAWDPVTQSNYQQFWDTKRPGCTWQGGACVFPDPNVGPTLNWNGDMEKVNLPLNSSGEGAATGGMAVQIVPHLKFMSKFWGDGYDESASPASFNPSIGEKRNGVWTSSRDHNGSQGGAYAFAIHYGGNASCPGSKGVDVIVSVNQNIDKLCPGGGNCSGATYAYNKIKQLMDTAVCAVDWSKVTPVPWLND
jgi:hypothetical protein